MDHEIEDADHAGYSRSALMRRGWSHRMIVDLLGAPDATAESPRFPSGVRMQVFSFKRVAAVEATEAFAEAMAAKQAHTVRT